MPKKKKLSLEEFNATAGDDSNEEVDELPSAPEYFPSKNNRLFISLFFIIQRTAQ